MESQTVYNKRLKVHSMRVWEDPFTPLVGTVLYNISPSWARFLILDLGDSQGADWFQIK